MDKNVVNVSINTYEFIDELVKKFGLQENDTIIEDEDSEIYASDFEFDEF